eukprot:365560-Chlamydomonas_euryale.AAC.6
MTCTASCRRALRRSRPTTQSATSPGEQGGMSPTAKSPPFLRRVWSVGGGSCADCAAKPKAQPGRVNKKECRPRPNRPFFAAGVECGRWILRRSHRETQSAAWPGEQGGMSPTAKPPPFLRRVWSVGGGACADCAVKLTAQPGRVNKTECRPRPNRPLFCGGCGVWEVDPAQIVPRNVAHGQTAPFFAAGVDCGRWSLRRLRRKTHSAAWPGCGQRRPRPLSSNPLPSRPAVGLKKQTNRSAFVVGLAVQAPGRMTCKSFVAPGAVDQANAFTPAAAPPTAQPLRPAGRSASRSVSQLCMRAGQHATPLEMGGAAQHSGLVCGVSGGLCGRQWWLVWGLNGGSCGA